jgi:KUP system potassium uptake protein
MVRPFFVSSTKSSLAALTLGAIGVVYGDIGTSVLYAMKEVFGSGHVPFTPENVYGILSIFFWTLTTIVSVKYVVLVLRADNHGEGGLVAMLALASQSVKDKPQLRKVLLVVGIFGTCLFYGDGVITPAISVLSAHPGDFVWLVLGAKARHGGHRQILWPDHLGLVCRHRCAGGVAHRSTP